MTYVLDTNVVSALRVPGRHPAVAAWADSVQVAEQFVVAITLAEIERGVIAKERTDPTQSEHLRRWFDDKVLRIFVFAPAYAADETTPTPTTTPKTAHPSRA